MSKKYKELKMVADLAERYRKMSDEQLLNITKGYGLHWDIKYRKALNIVLKERGLKVT
jgi:alpha-D-ribose 1-methylphosphonate 5-triphosphate synthase subunit PhnI